MCFLLVYLISPYLILPCLTSLVISFGKVSQKSRVLLWGVDHATKATSAADHVYLIARRTSLPRHELLLTKLTVAGVRHFWRQG